MAAQETSPVLGRLRPACTSPDFIGTTALQDAAPLQDNVNASLDHIDDDSDVSIEPAVTPFRPNRRRRLRTIDSDDDDCGDSRSTSVTSSMAPTAWTANRGRHLGVDSVDDSDSGPPSAADEPSVGFEFWTVNRGRRHRVTDSDDSDDECKNTSETAALSIPSSQATRTEGTDSPDWRIWAVNRGHHLRVVDSDNDCEYGVAPEPKKARGDAHTLHPYFTICYKLIIIITTISQQSSSSSLVSAETVNKDVEIDQIQSPEGLPP